MNCLKCGGPVTVNLTADPYTPFKGYGVCTNPKCGGVVVVKDGTTVRVN
jgi:hypothetical protein